MECYYRDMNVGSLQKHSLQNIDVQELCEKERQETARVKEQLQAAQKQALDAGAADKVAAQALQQEQTQLLQDLRDQMKKLQDDLHTSEVQTLQKPLLHLVKGILCRYMNTVSEWPPYLHQFLGVSNTHLLNE